MALPGADPGRLKQFCVAHVEHPLTLCLMVLSRQLKGLAGIGVEPVPAALKRRRRMKDWFFIIVLVVAAVAIYNVMPGDGVPMHVSSQCCDN